MQTNFMANSGRSQTTQRWLAVLTTWWQHRLAVPALLVLTIAFGVLAWQFNLVADTTHNHRNTLSAASKQVLQQLPGRIEVTAFCSNSPYKGRYFRKSITALVQRYQHLHVGLDLQFIDPAALDLDVGLHRQIGGDDGSTLDDLRHGVRPSANLKKIRPARL